MKPASSLARNDTAPTRSVACSDRLIDCIFKIISNSASLDMAPASLRASVPGVRVSPGAMALTVTPCGPRSGPGVGVAPGGDGMNGAAVRTDLGGERAGEADHAGFAGDVMHEVGNQQVQ